MLFYSKREPVLQSASGQCTWINVRMFKISLKTHLRDAIKSQQISNRASAFFFNQKEYKSLYLPVWMSFHRTQDLDWSSKITKQRCLCLSICGKHKSKEVLINLVKGILSGCSMIIGCINVCPLQGKSQHLQCLICKKVFEH